MPRLLVVALAAVIVVTGVLRPRQRSRTMPPPAVTHDAAPVAVAPDAAPAIKPDAAPVAVVSDASARGPVDADPALAARKALLAEYPELISEHFLPAIDACKRPDDTSQAKITANVAA